MLPAMSDRDHLPMAAGVAAALPLIIKGVLGLFAVAALVAMALGKVGVAIGGGGLAAFILYALGSSIVKNRRLKKAMEESDRT